MKNLVKVSFLTVGANVHNNFFFWYDSFPDIGVTELHIVTELRTVTELPLPQTLPSLCFRSIRMVAKC